MHWEKVSAWSSDFGFGKRFKGSIEKMAMVGRMKSDDDARDWLNS